MNLHVAQDRKNSELKRKMVNRLWDIEFNKRHEGNNPLDPPQPQEMTKMATKTSLIHPITDFKQASHKIDAIMTAANSRNFIYQTVKDVDFRKMHTGNEPVESSAKVVTDVEEEPMLGSPE